MALFTHSLDHLLAELERLDLLVRIQVWRARQLHAGDNGLSPYYISEGEVDALLAQVVGRPLWADVPLSDNVYQTVQTAIAKIHTQIDARKMENKAAGRPLRLDLLSEQFNLLPVDVDILLLCLAPELDLRYLRLYAYLQDDLNLKLPTVDLALNLICPDIEAKAVALQRFQRDAPLIHYQILRLVPTPSYATAPLLAQSFQLNERIRRFLLEDDSLDEALADYVAVVDTRALSGNLPLQTEGAVFHPVVPLKNDTEEKLLILARQTPQQVFYFQGAAHTGRQQMALALGRELGRQLVVVNGRYLQQTEPEAFTNLARLADREARLQNAILYWSDFDGLMLPEKSRQQAALIEMLVNRPDLTILAGADAWHPGARLGTVPSAVIPFTLPAASERATLWASHLNGETEQIDLAQLVAQFRLGDGQIRDAILTAFALARWRDPAKIELKTADLVAASRLHSNQQLAALAQKITPHYHWEDIVLPAEQLNQLRRMCDQFKYRAQVLETWGFEQKLALGKGLNALFSGPPGTGKTMAADIMATELGLDLYKIDLATVVSKYIGETEKNLAHIFSEAETSNAILFFDEADALFGKRTEVKDAHDRYANLEISYLLQRMDEYEGVVILATNLRQNIDRAFLRRLHFIIEFPFPSVDDRRRIWQQIWPAAAPLDEQVDLDLLADKLEISGGHIRNIALAAAFLAAADNSVICKHHLAEAAESEYKKIGKLLDTVKLAP
ncbi:MAG: ATP-binding protein [Ardenticatenaceae bacterium]|nr:ATP-binding protein [Ardenticatenaceae bacterium]